jgi:transposase InsO family protein
VIVHTNRGTQYTTGEYQKMIKGHALRCNMSGKGNCYDNACVATVFHSLKGELTHGKRFATRQRLHREVFEYVETDHSGIRRHGTRGYISPEAFEAIKVA